MCPVGAECCRPPHRAAPATAAAKRDGAMVDVASLTCTRSYVARVNLACWKFQISRQVVCARGSDGSNFGDDESGFYIRLPLPNCMARGVLLQ